MSEGDMDDLSRLLRGEYNPPPEVPRDEMWAAIQGGLEPRIPGVASLDEARRRRWAALRRPAGWAAAAAAVLVMGVAIGRMTAPAVGPVAEIPLGSDASILRVAAVQHLGRSEALLRMVRADAQSGRLDPMVSTWARGLLTETRLLLDSSENQDPAMRELLEDLELVLMQIVGVSAVPGEDDSRAREELSLALKGLERREVLPRIQAVMPSGAGLAGT